jgi:hypothetical protein
MDFHYTKHTARLVSIALAIFTLSFGVFGVPTQIAKAESPALITILGVDTSKFPEMSIWFSAIDATGVVIPDLPASQLSVVENGKVLPVKKISFEDPGVRLTVAFNPGPSLAYYAGGATRFDRMRQSLIDSAKGLTSPNDDYSLITSNGILTSRNPEIKQWASLLGQFEPNLKKPSTGLSSLTQALDLTAGANPRDYMKQVVLFITPMPSADQLKLIPQITAQAVQLGVNVFIWLAGPSFAENSLEARVLRDMATTTGGSLLIFSGTEKLPSLADYLTPLRGVYRLDYTSKIDATGANTIAVKHTENGVDTVSIEYPLELTVEAPNPVLLSPPQSITRTETRVAGQKKDLLIPLNQPILIAVEFPDGHERPLASSRLYVDGDLAGENKMAPFNQFIWDLTPYLAKGSHILRVEVTDTLGLSRSTIDTPVELDILYKPSLLAAASLNRLAILFAILLAGTALVLVLIFMGRRNWFSESRRKKRKEYLDPVTQPVDIHQEQSLLRRPAPAGINGDIKVGPIPCLVLEEEDAPSTVIPLDGEDITLGSDHNQASIFLDSPSIDPLHSRITRDEIGSTWISDLGSVAGTWVNYTPISRNGVRLEAGDLVQIGKLTFRFQPASTPK